MKIENNPGSYGLLVGLLVMLLGVFANASCSHVPPPNQPLLEVLIGARNAAQQAAASVKIITDCGSGSGVLVDDSHVLTAAHVVNCAGWPLMVPPELLVVETLDGTRYTLTSAEVDGYRDLARLTLADKVKGINPVPIRHATVHDKVCWAASVPKREVKCGKVGDLDQRRDYGDVELVTGSVWFGNSGSGVYDSGGALIGLAVRLHWCNMLDAMIWDMAGIEPNQMCGGRISSIDDSALK